METPLTQDEYTVLLGADATNEARFGCGENGVWSHRGCGISAQFTEVAHPIWDGPFDEGGRGSCDYRRIPWCPKCDERRPDYESGKPVRVPLFPGQPAEILPRLAERLRANLFTARATLLKA